MSRFVVEDRGGFRQVPVNRLLTIGRSPGNDLVLDAVFASRRHAWVWSQGDQVILEDLGSTYGTLVNGQTARAPVFLNYGDVVQIGEARLTYVGEGDAAPYRGAKKTPPRGTPRLMASQVFCARCGAANDPRAHFCGNCGYGLDLPAMTQGQGLAENGRLTSHPITPLEPVVARPFPTDVTQVRPRTDRRLWVLILILAMLAVILVTIVAALLVIVLG